MQLLFLQNFHIVSLSWQLNMSMMIKDIRSFGNAFSLLTFSKYGMVISFKKLKWHSGVRPVILTKSHIKTFRKVKFRQTSISFPCVYELHGKKLCESNNCECTSYLSFIVHDFYWDVWRTLKSKSVFTWWYVWQRRKCDFTLKCKLFFG